MYSKIMITGTIEIMTGMHIGTGGEFAAIGAADSPVVRDKLTMLPIIPGSSLKGKLRSMLARKYCPAAESANDDNKEITNLFGGISVPSRLIFSDMLLSNQNELESKNVFSPTEVKFENYISRLTAVANPRQIERVIRGSKFDMEIIYTITDNVKMPEADPIADMKLLCEAMKLLQYDYLGGSGTRGYGKIKFNDVNAELITGEIDDAVIDDINNIFGELN